MLTPKQIKNKYIPEYQKNPNKYYPVEAIKSFGFTRNQCGICKKFFWDLDSKRQICDDSSCTEGFTFIDKKYAKNKMNYVETWKKFVSILKTHGYKEIKRYPVTARWRDDLNFVEASIDNFIPYVINGEIKPPANPLIVPQFCLRFNDVDNVGITNSHFTGFVMVGQHRFEQPKDYDPNAYLKHLMDWFLKGLRIDLKDITLHEEVWAGSGKFGPAIEFFSGGLELCNQVYMQYEVYKKSYRDLKLKTLDMGLGLERNTWFSQGTNTAYESVFPNVCKKLYQIGGLNVDNELMRKFLPYASYLNLDEVDDINKAWLRISEKIGVDVKTLKDEIIPLAGLYSIGEHTRALLVALSDGALPSNSGGGYNLRMLLRRSLGFIDKYNWEVKLHEICKWHADYLKPIFPELSKNLNEVQTILDYEETKFNSTKKRSKKLVFKILNKDIKTSKLIELYDSQGIPPEIIKTEARSIGKEIYVPDNFYSMISELHKERGHKLHKKKEINIEIGFVEDTKRLYYEDYKLGEFDAKVLKVIDNYVILDQTIFYPTSGGQLHDIGFINDYEVIEVFKQDNVIIHKLKHKSLFKEGDNVVGKINLERRQILARHHTATHIVNAACKFLLGNHINQAGAKKTTSKAHLDITHYKTISDNELELIEKKANEIVNKNIPISLSFVDRDEAEKLYGMSIYQGGAVPGKKLRIVNIPKIDVECCGGTHVLNTSEVGVIKILRSSKISDSVVRIEFIAGSRVKDQLNKSSNLLEESARILDVTKNVVPARAKELFDKWKKVVKKKKYDKDDLHLINFDSENSSDEDLLKKTALILKTQAEHVPKTLKRFIKEWKEKISE